MKAFTDIKTAMRDNAHGMTHPNYTSAPPMRKYRALQEGAAPSSISEPAGYARWLEAAFAYTTHASATNAPIVLSSCLMNGKPAHVIGAIRRLNGEPHVTPLFLACQPWMKFAADPTGQKVLRVDDFIMDMDEAGESTFERRDA